MNWEAEKAGGTYVRIRCVGFNNEQHLTHRISPAIRRHFEGKPCIFTGRTTSVELDHRAGHKDHPLHKHADDPELQGPEDFMPLCRTMNQLKREVCKECCRTGTRPDVPPLFGGGAMKKGPGCHGCFWFEPESYVP